MHEPDLWMVLLLVGTGTVAGFVNVLAAGGSFLTIPALMLFGIPADLANATNRVGVMLQTLAALRGFSRHGLLVRSAIPALLLPTIAGAVVGSLGASYLPLPILEPVLLATLMAMAATMVLRPATLTPPPDSVPLSPLASPAGFIALFLAGVYGGFLQAGVGFVLLPVLVGLLHYDLVRANALKIVATGLFTAVALAIFIVRDQILWIPGLLLGLGSMLGAQLAVRFAVAVDARVLRWFLLITVITVCTLLWFRAG